MAETLSGRAPRMTSPFASVASFGTYPSSEDDVLTLLPTEEEHEEHQGQDDGLPDSVFVADDAPVYDVPMEVIRRPLMSHLDATKVQDFKCKLQGGEELTPIEVAWVERPEGHYYFAFGGCHRWAAHSELKRSTIRAKLIRVSPSTINTYLGASSPFRAPSMGLARAGDADLDE